MATYFELILVLATLFTGIVWAVDHFMFLPKRKAVVDGLPKEIDDDARASVLQESALVDSVSQLELEQQQVRAQRTTRGAVVCNSWWWWW